MTHDDAPEDVKLGALLRDTAAVPPLDDVDWAALHARTTAGATALLNRRRRSWWQVLGSDSVFSGRLAAAAAAAVLVTGTVLMPQRPGATATAEFRTIEEELALSVPYVSVPLLAEDAGSGAVIDALLLYDQEAW